MTNIYVFIMAGIYAGLLFTLAIMLREKDDKNKDEVKEIDKNINQLEKKLKKMTLAEAWEIVEIINEEIEAETEEEFKQEINERLEEMTIAEKIQCKMILDRVYELLKNEEDESK